MISTVAESDLALLIVIVSDWSVGVSDCIGVCS